MDNSSSPSFTNLLNSSMSSSDPAEPSLQHHTNFNPHNYAMNYPPSNFYGHYPHNTNPFGGPSSFQHFPSIPASYHGGPYQGNMGQFPQGFFGGYAANGPASPVGSIGLFGASGGSSTRGDEGSPIASASPASRAHPKHANHVIPIEEGSDSSTDDHGKKGGRIIWSEEENLRLVSAWLKNSNDPIEGNGKKREHYWKEIAADYNKHAPKEQRRTALQCKEHWNKNIPFINKFNGIYNDIKNTYASGQSEEQLMEKVRAKYKSVMKKKRPFALEHWWVQVKDQPKWARAYPIEEVHKRCRLNAAGAYSSSTQDTDAADVAEIRRPQGQKAAKAIACCPPSSSRLQLGSSRDDAHGWPRTWTPPAPPRPHPPSTGCTSAAAAASAAYGLYQCRGDLSPGECVRDTANTRRRRSCRVRRLPCRRGEG